MWEDRGVSLNPSSYPSSALQFAFRPYCRLFQPSLQTHHGLWQQRQGIILRLIDPAGNVTWGEIAPLPWFGTESFEAALDFCQQLPTTLTDAILGDIPPTLPACQFGFASARQGWSDPPLNSSLNSPSNCAGLLPAGEAALEAWSGLWQQGYRTFKWKIGVAPTSQELELFTSLLQELPPLARLRLDANGGLTPETARDWLQVCDRAPTDTPNKAQVEFLEQPLPVDQFDEMLTLSREFTTPLALDESVATLEQLQTCYERGWRGIFVIKPAIAGSPQALHQFCQAHPIDAVFSSVFETAIGRRAALHLAQTLMPLLKTAHAPRALGFGTRQWFADDGLDTLDFEQLWQSL